MTKIETARPGSLDSVYDCAMTWRYMAPIGHTLEMCLAPGYWNSCLREVGMQRVLGRHAFNRIEIIAEDGSWEADIRIVSVKDGLVEARVLRQWVDEAAAREAPEGYKVEHITNNGWRAMDPSGRVLTEKAFTRAKALDAAEAHAREMGAATESARKVAGGKR